MVTPTPGSKPTVSVSHLLQEKNKGDKRSYYFYALSR